MDWARSLKELRWSRQRETWLCPLFHFAVVWFLWIPEFMRKFWYRGYEPALCPVMVVKWEVAGGNGCLGREIMSYWVNFGYIFKDLFIHERDTHREKQRHKQREKQAPCREPDVGLNPRTLGSHPGPKQMLNHWATQWPHDHRQNFQTYSSGHSNSKSCFIVSSQHASCGVK